MVLDSSNEYGKSFVGGVSARNKTEDVAKNFIIHEWFTMVPNPNEFMLNQLIIGIKQLGFSKHDTIMKFVKTYNLSYVESRAIISNSKAWKS